MYHPHIKSETIASTLAEEIIRGDLEPGSRLAQDHIARRFQSSHVPVREALQKLVQMELAVSESRRGVRVVSLSRTDHDEILEMRLVLEPLALRNSIENLDDADIKHIQKHQIACDESEDAITWEKANRDFHMAILAPCKRPRLLRQIEHLQRLSAHRFHSRWRTDWLKVSNDDHTAIVQALINRDVDVACIILKRHLVK